MEWSFQFCYTNYCCKYLVCQQKSKAIVVVVYNEIS